MAAAGLLRHHLRRHLHSSRLNHYFHSRRSPPLPFRSFSSTGSEEDGSFPGEDLTLPEVPTSGFDSPVGGEGLWDGPVRALTLVLDVYHDVSSLPWWLVISTSTLALRISLVPLLIFQLKKMGMISQYFPKLPPPFPPPFSGISFREQFLLHRKKRRELGCPSFLWSFAFFSVQFPCFLLGVTTIRRMCLGGHHGFDSGGILWFQNLTDFPHGVCAPIFPMLIAGLHFINVQISFEKLDAAKLPGLIGLFAKYYKIYLNLLSLPLFFIGFYIPQGSLVYWCTNSSLTLVQQLCLRNAKIREKLGLPDTSDNKMAKSTSAKLPGKEILPLEAQFSRESLLHEGDGLVEHQQSSQTEELSPEELLELGLQNMAANNHDKALSLLRLATEKDPGLVRGLIAIGQILYSKKSQAEAIEYFERAISKVGEEEASMLILASFGAGLSHISQGNDPEAIEHLRRISRLKEPEAPMDKACYYEGLVILASKLFQGDAKAEAAEYLRRAADYDPKFQAFCKECEQWLEEHKEENR